MAVLNAVIVPGKVLKGGRHKIRISVAHNGETRYITTSIILDSSKEFKNGAVVKRPDAAMLNTKLRGILQSYQSVIDELQYIDGLSCPELIYQIKNAGNNKNRTLASIFNEYMSLANLKPRSIILYNYIWSTLSKHINEKMIAENITHSTILSLDKSLRKKVCPTSVNNYMTFFFTLLNFAKRCGYVEYKINPMEGYSLPQTTPRQSWLSVDEVRVIRDFELKKKNHIKCRDFFMLSYYLGGINIVDLLDINFNEQTETLHYIRRKTELLPKLNKFVEFKIPDEAKPIINRYKGSDGRLKVSALQKKVLMGPFFRFNFHRIAEMTGIKQIVYYSARKSFSQHAFLLGVPTPVIDYILGHRVDKAGASLYSYIKVTPEQATDAVRKVLDNLK